MEKEDLLRAWEQTDAGVSFAALARLALDQGWNSVPEGKQAEYLEAALRYDRAFHEARREMFAQIIEGANPVEAARRFGQKLEELSKEFVLAGIRMGERSADGKDLLEVLEDLVTHSHPDRELEQIAQEVGIDADQIRQMEEEARAYLRRFLAELKAEIEGEDR